MIILGVSHPISLNTAACILVDGQLVAMVEEERLNRQKHAPHAPPVLAVDYCLRTAGARMDDVDAIAVGFGRPWDAAVGHMQLAELRKGWRSGLRWMIELIRYQQSIPGYGKKRMLFINHHIAHAASSYYASGFDEAMILSLDGSGGSESGILAYGQGDRIRPMARVSNEGSWGVLYEEVTELLGFRRHSGEGKTMGLAPYSSVQGEVFPFIDWDAPVPRIDPQGQRRHLSQIVPRRKKDPLTEEHKRLAAQVQSTLERAAVQMVQELHRRTGSRRLCLAGGTALNCSMNGVLRQLDEVDAIYIQPAAHDAGTALGAALEAHRRLTGQRPPFVMEHVYWGPEYSNDEIAAALHESDLTHYRLSDDICNDTAEVLAAGKLVGWFQGRIEIGPRALGARSILAHPGLPDMKDRVNLQVKRREPWRPFAPSMLEEYTADYLVGARPAPFMLQAFDVLPERRDDLISAIHVDNSCRPQTVSQRVNPRYWRMIDAFRQRTGIAAVLNTSFNLDSQPIVCRPAEAIWTFENSGLDYLAIGDYLAWKDEG
jgi:carbamoyltransferase